MDEASPRKKMSVVYESEYDMVYVDLRRLDSPQDVHDMWDKINQERKKSRKELIMVDISKSDQKNINSATRKAFKEYTDEYNTFSKIAYIVTSPILRMLLKATVTAVDKNQIGRIFKTRQEGLAWIEGKGD